MSPTGRTRDSRLATLQRLRELELEEARVERVRVEARAEADRQRLHEMQQALNSTRDLERSRVTAVTGVSAATLRAARDYARWQAQEIVVGERALRVSERLSELARSEVGRRFERVAVIERLRERGSRESSIEGGRLEQRSLDDQALTRAHNHSEERRR
ncbi:MAG TPA: hypothetical protein VGM84_06990 [Steroidobacteraceae bacterium]